ncbi:hypothetical protein MNBD_CPR01-17 [hydrothermal vent metagenome]|uniref:Uncharacterized protein n=1 Tax=hydrothermal vent metagenome TaxID=652676 RepID=A0A3B0ULJ7_9ZZZZ
MFTNHTVLVEPFAERHYIKGFKKKYKNAWKITWRAVQKEFQNFDVLFERNIAETIINSNLIKVCKTEFRIAGTKHSRHGSGNRCIVALHNGDIPKVVILLVYHKNNLVGSGNETAKWKNLIKKNYPAYKSIL